VCLVCAVGRVYHINILYLLIDGRIHVRTKVAIVNTYSIIYTFRPRSSTRHNAKCWILFLEPFPSYIMYSGSQSSNNILSTYIPIYLIWIRELLRLSIISCTFIITREVRVNEKSCTDQSMMRHNIRYKIIRAN